MRSWVLVFLLTSVVDATLAEAPLLVGGGGGSGLGYGLVCGPPLYDYFLQACYVGINISSPVNGSVHWLNTLDVNVSVSGVAGAFSCDYSIDGHNWTSLDCLLGERVTFPRGEETLRVRVIREGCVAYDEVQFTILSRSGGASYPLLGLLVLGGTLMFIILADEEKLRKKRRGR